MKYELNEIRNAMVKAHNKCFEADKKWAGIEEREYMRIARNNLMIEIEIALQNLNKNIDNSKKS